MRKFLFLAAVGVTACGKIAAQDNKQPAIAPVSVVPPAKLICNPASKGLWWYNADNTLEICGPDKAGVLTWQRLAWAEPKAPAAPAPAPAK